MVAWLTIYSGELFGELFRAGLKWDRVEPWSGLLLEALWVDWQESGIMGNCRTPQEERMRATLLDTMIQKTDRVMIMGHLEAGMMAEEAGMADNLEFVWNEQ